MSVWRFLLLQIQSLTIHYSQFKCSWTVNLQRIHAYLSRNQVVSSVYYLLAQQGKFLYRRKELDNSAWEANGKLTRSTLIWKAQRGSDHMTKSSGYILLLYFKRQSASLKCCARKTLEKYYKEMSVCLYIELTLPLTFTHWHSYPHSHIWSKPHRNVTANVVFIISGFKWTKTCAEVKVWGRGN